MRIALDATYSIDPHPSGIAVYSQELLSGLARLFPQDEFLHCYRPKQLRKAPRPASPNVHRRLLFPPLPTFRADLFHALNQRIDHRPARRVVATFHDLFVLTADYSSPDFRTRFAEQARHAARNSDLIIAVSQFTADQVMSLLSVDRSRIRVIPHGVHEPPTDPAVAREKMVLFVGALQKRKNVTRLVEAFGSLPQAWTLMLAGAPSGYQASDIFGSIERSPCRNRIRITGYLARADLDRLYARASIFAFPSLDEGFGMPVLEAMAYGVPVITSNRSAVAEVAGDAAILVDPEQTDDLRRALTQLAGDAELRLTLIEQGRSRVRRYTWEEAIRRTHAVYQELLST